MHVVIKKDKNYVLHLFTGGINVSMCEVLVIRMLSKTH